MAKITDVDDARAYFETATPETRSILSCRGALRVAANLGRKEGTAFDRLALASFRAMVTSAGRSLGRPADVDWLERAARSAAYSARSAAFSSAFSADSASAAAAFSARSAASAAFSADSASASAAFSARSSASSAFSADSASASAAFSSASADTDHVPTGGADWEHFQGKPVWPSFEGVEHMEAAHDAFLKRLAQSPDWNWWRGWYEQMWDGTFTDWDFALDVAKIDWDAPEGESVWDKGPAAVAARIEELERGYRQDLLRQIQALKAQLAADIPDRHGIGGNYPPEPIQVDELPRQVRESLVIWEPVSDFEAEASSDTPDKGRARKALEQLVAAAKACGIWAAGHGDTVIGAGAKAVGAAGGTAIVAWIAGYGAQIVKIIETAKLWIGGLL